MDRTHKNFIRQALALLLCILLMLGVLPSTVFAVTNPLALPDSVSLTSMSGVPFVSGQEVTPGEGFNVTYNYTTVPDIDASAKYQLPTLSNQLEVLRQASEDEIVTFTVKDAEQVVLGTLEINTKTGAMTFQFDVEFDYDTIDNFFLQFSVQLDEDNVNMGDDIRVSFPIQGGTANFDITVVDKEKDSPSVKKSGAQSSYDPNTGNVEVLWTITVTNGANPQKVVSIRDKWSDNSEYIEGSFCVDGEPVTEGLTLNGDDISLEYELKDILPSSVNTITYKTRFKSSAFLNKGVPITSGSITCTNIVQPFYPDGSTVSLSPEAKASYKHNITWLYKTSGNVIDRSTGEMEWTITIYNNGLGMQNVVLYDRLSPGVSIKNETATMQIGNGSPQRLDNFSRASDTDLAYGGDESKKYNLTYDLGNIGSIAVIKYRTIITNMSEYDAGSHLPPDSIFDNRAFITYQIPSGGGISSIIVSPVVEKSGGYDTGLIGKEGVIEPAFHTIKWTMTVNNNGETLKGVTLNDKLTYADPITVLPTEYRLCNHIYDDLIERNRPLYSLDGEEFKKFTLYDVEKPNIPFTYRLVKTGTEVYDIVFYLGDISGKVIITFRSTATDKIIYANNITSNYCGYENKASVLTIGNAFSYATAEVIYKSDVFQKSDARSFFSKTEHTYDFGNNRLPWLMRVNINQMEMTNICITDFLSAGTSLVEGTMIVGSGTGAWYKLTTLSDTKAIPKFTEGAAKPYYTYNEETRELNIFLEDITGSVVGTENATKQIVFYVQVDVDHQIFSNPDYTDPNYEGYIENKGGLWSIPNIGSLENGYLSGDNAVKESAVFNVIVQHLNKSGTAYKNGQNYSIDYSIGINRIQKTLPDPAVIKDVLPAGLQLDASTIHLYEATVLSPDIFYVRDDGTNGKIEKGAGVDPSLYTVETEINTDGTTTMRVTLPDNSGAKMYVLDYSCDVIDVSKAPFVNSASIEGIELSNAEQTITRIVLTNAAGGGALRDAVKTTAGLTKTDSVTGNPVQGAVFGIYYKGVLLATETTDENGRLTFANLNLNHTYTITELEPARGYLAPENASEIFVASENELTFENTPIEGTVHFTKTDDGGTVLSGAEFGIWRTAADIGGNTPLATATSGENGVVYFTSLTAGNTYYIAEISAPENYRISDEVIVAKMDIDGEMEKLWLQSDTEETAITDFPNTPIPYTSLTVTKVWDDDDNPSRPESVTVQLYCDGEEYGDAVILNDENEWNVTWEELDESFTWTVGEIDAPEGYTTSMLHEGTNWTITNSKVVDITVTKVWDDDDNPSRPESVTVQLYCDGEEYGDSVILNDENEWTVTWEELDESFTWTVGEIDAPEGYTTSMLQDGTNWTITNSKINDATVDITGTKTLTGGDKTTAGITDGQFTFNMVSDSENDSTGFTGLNPTASVKAGGEIDFGTLSFSKTGTFKFTITENDLGEDRYTYDNTAFGVEIVVTFEEDTNSLKAEVTITKLSDGNVQDTVAEAITFVNSYEPEIPEPPQTGDSCNINLLFGLLTLSITGLITLALLATQKKQHKVK